MNPNLTDEQQIRKYYELVNPDNNPRWGVVFPPVKGNPALFSSQVNSVDDALKMCREYNGKGMCCSSVNGMQGGAKAANVTSVDNIFVDYDVYKKRKVEGLSTEEDKQASLAGIRKIIEELRNVINLQPSLLVGSGNAHQTMIPLSIKISKDPEERNAQLKDIQARLAVLYEKLKKFDTDVAHIDVGVITDVARKCKFPGTLNRKEGMKPPYRKSVIIEAYEDIPVKTLAEGNTVVFNALKAARERSIPAPVKQMTTPVKKGAKTKLLKPCMTWSHDAGDRWEEDQGNSFRKAIAGEMYNQQWPLEKVLNFFKTHDELSGEEYSEKTTKYQFEHTEKKDYDKTGCEKLRMKCPSIVKPYCSQCPQNRSIPIVNAGSRIATLYIRGFNKFEIKGKDGATVVSLIEGGKKGWYSSIVYRRLIVNALNREFNLVPGNADRIAEELSNKAKNRINMLRSVDAFKTELSVKEQQIYDSIRRISCTPADEGNIFNIYIDGKVIEINDIDLGKPLEFIFQYRNRFFKQIEISKDAWNDVFIPYILEEGKKYSKSRLPSKADIVVEVFLQYLKNKKPYDWDDIEMRRTHTKNIYYERKKNRVRISSPFIHQFFNRKKIEKTYGPSTISFASHLNRIKFKEEERKSGKVPGKDGLEQQSWWMFYPKKLGLTEADIREEDEKKEKPQSQRKVI